MGEAAFKLDPHPKEDAALPSTLAEEGVADWFARLPLDDWTDALVESEFTRVKWVDSEGFVEVRE